MTTMTAKLRSALGRALVFALIAAPSLARRAEAAFVVFPGAQAATEGSGNNLFPFGLGDDVGEVPSGTQRYQQIYAASGFAGLAPGGEYITQIAFRPDASLGHAFSSTLPGIRIDLSTTGAGVDALSSTFASNIGANDTIVYGGASGSPLFLSSLFTGPASGPKDFDIIITLTTPFFYNPAAGNLLLDVRNFGGGRTAIFDAQEIGGDSISRAFTMPSGVGSSTADGTDTLGLVTRFTTAVPEPASITLLAVGLLALTRLPRRS